jgi:hypothetical protein
MPDDVAAVLSQLELTDFEGLRSQSVMEKALAVLAVGPAELPNALMERLTDQEAQLVSKVASEREPPVRNLDNCVQMLRFSRMERQLLEIQQDIDRGRREDRPDEALNQLLRQKNALRSQLEHARRGPRDGYNR